MQLMAVGRHLLWLATLAGTLGCNSFSSPEEESWDEEFFAVEEAPPAEAVSTEPASRTSAVEPAAPLASSLALQLKVGDRFPLSKTIDQRLTQSANGEISVSTSRLELLLSLNVDAEQGGDRRITVQYHRVRFSQDVGGQQVSYSSDAPPAVLPPEVAGYAGLVGNGFAFWLTKNNQLRNLEGFEEFTRRCAAAVPPELQQQAIQALSSGQGPEGLANFVDDSIALLPFDASKTLQEGSLWELPVRRISQPVPLEMTTRCIVKTMTPEFAELSLIGTLNSNEAMVRPVTASDLQVLVRGGHVAGTCRIDRATGMPAESRVDRYLEMQLVLPDGTEVQQRKDTITQIAAYLDQQPPRPLSGGMAAPAPLSSSETSFDNNDQPGPLLVP